MRKIQEVLRLTFEENRSQREIARSLNIGHSTVGEYLARFKEAGLSWPLPEGWDDIRLEAELYPPPLPVGTSRPLPDWNWVHRELSKRKKTKATLQLLWLEYRADHPEDGYGYSRFCELFREWQDTLDVACRQPYRAGEKAFVDYAGQRVEIVDRSTGEVWLAGLRRCPRCLELHLLGSHPIPQPSRLDGVSRSDVRVLGRLSFPPDSG
jgi:transposase